MRKETLKLLLLPGLDGTGLLFERFRRALSPALTCHVCPLPIDGQQDPAALADHIAATGCLEDDTIILAESFSGPVAYQLLRAHEQKVRGLILVSSFLTVPRPLLLLARYLPLRWFPWHWSPSWALRRFCVGRSAPIALVKEVQRAIRSIPALTIAKRVRSLSSLNKPDRPIEVPCLLLQPGDDRLVPTSHVTKLKRWCRNLSVRHIEGPHFLLQARPQECAAAVSEFLVSLTEPR